MYNVFIGFDLGAKCGISEVTEQSMSTHEINFGSRKEEPLRYKKFWDHIGTIFDKYDYEKTIVYYEYVARHLGTKAAHAFGAYRMILLMACYDRNIKVEYLSVQAIKKAATGKGAAPKDAMIESATNRFNPDWNITDNEADSMWIAYLGRSLTSIAFPETIEEYRPLQAIKGNVPNDSGTSESSNKT